MTSRIQQKEKDAETVKVQPLPSATQFRARLMALHFGISSAVNGRDHILAFMRKVEDPESTYESLADMGKFKKMLKLAER